MYGAALRFADLYDGDGATPDGVCQSGVFGMAWGPGTTVGPPMYALNGDAYYLWKAMVLEFSRWTILTTGIHPIGGWNTSPNPKPPFTDFYPSPALGIFNEYAQAVHENMIGFNSYTLPLMNRGLRADLQFGPDSGDDGDDPRDPAVRRVAAADAEPRSEQLSDVRVSERTSIITVPWLSRSVCCLRMRVLFCPDGIRILLGFQRAAGGSPR